MIYFDSFRSLYAGYVLALFMLSNVKSREIISIFVLQDRLYIGTYILGNIFITFLKYCAKLNI